MVRVAFLLASLLLLTALAGCSDDGDGDGETTSSTSTGSSIPDPCPTATGSSRVEGFTAYGGQWAFDLQTGGPICGKGDAALNSLVSDSFGAFTDMEATMTFKMLERDAVEFDAGAGMVIHFKDDANFVILRYSPREQGWHLFTMIDGERVKRNGEGDDASVTPPTTNPEFGQTVSFRVVSDGGHVTAYDGTTRVIDYMLPDDASPTGKVGYFLRADQAAQFSALVAVAT